MSATPELTGGKALRDCLLTGLLTVDPKGQIYGMTPGLGPLFGLPPEAAVARMSDLPESLRALIEEALSLTKAVSTEEHQFQAASGIVLRCRILPVIKITGERALGVLVSGVSVRSDVERTLYHLDRLASVGALGASTAHEMRNALVAIKTFVDLLLDRHQDADLAPVVQSEMQRLNGMVSHMLSFAGTSEDRKEPIRLGEVLQRTLTLLKPEIVSKDIALECSLSAEEDGLHGNAGQLQQALLNLFLNSLEAMGAGGRLQVDLKRVPAASRTYLQLTIADSGGGMSEESVRRLFEPFFTTKPDGTGLGLVITQRIISEHQGTVSAQNRPGEGVSFVITLPAASA